MTPLDALVIAAGYLAGSLPMGLFVGRLRGVDLRAHGSGNIGATNAGRVLGKRWFFVVFALDFAKSFVPVLLAQRLGPGTPDERGPVALLTGVAAVLGHVFPVFLRFKGGKGVATAAGLFGALAPVQAAIAFVAWLVGTKGSGYVSVGSIAAAIVLPATCWLLPWALPDARLLAVDPWTRWAALLVAALIVWRHRSNIGRLLRGTEPRATGST